ncbi:helicase associated domain-containing protein [Streptomyces sp. NPDC087437]|uniref:helicase associated domain-containing protein n=1 Tax=Streptomyces sp. NPDC087437 TaxID=3365789 RepID=UPI00381E31F0
MPRRAGHGHGLERWHAQLFAEGLEQARLHVERFGYLAVADTDGRVREGFDLGRWLANRRADAVSLTVKQAAQLRRLDAWWKPPWPIDWQRAWYRARARAHVLEHGPVHGDDLSGLPSWVQRWLRHQINHYGQLREGQQRLLAELGLTRSEVERFHAWPGRVGGHVIPHDLRDQRQVIPHQRGHYSPPGHLPSVVLLDRLINASHQVIMTGASYRPDRRPKKPTDRN